MIQKRMLSTEIIGTDKFLNLPVSTQNLYMHLNIRANMEGFVSNPLSVLKMVGAEQEDLMRLLTMRYLLGFTTGAVVIVDWLVQNTLRADRSSYNECTRERELLWTAPGYPYYIRQDVVSDVQVLVDDFTPVFEPLNDRSDIESLYLKPEIPVMAETVADAEDAPEGSKKKSKSGKAPGKDQKSVKAKKTKKDEAVQKTESGKSPVTFDFENEVYFTDHTLNTAFVEFLKYRRDERNYVNTKANVNKLVQRMKDYPDHINLTAIQRAKSQGWAEVFPDGVKEHAGKGADQRQDENPFADHLNALFGEPADEAFEFAEYEEVVA